MYYTVTWQSDWLKFKIAQNTNIVLFSVSPCKIIFGSFYFISVLFIIYLLSFLSYLLYLLSLLLANAAAAIMICRHFILLSQTHANARR